MFDLDSWKLFEFKIFFGMNEIWKTYEILNLTFDFLIFEINSILWIVFFFEKQTFLFVYALIAFGWTLQINIHLKNLIFGTEWWKHKTWWTKKLKCQRKIRTLLVLDFVLIVRLFVCFGRVTRVSISKNDGTSAAAFRCNTKDTTYINLLKDTSFDICYFEFYCSLDKSISSTYFHHLQSSNFSDKLVVSVTNDQRKPTINMKHLRL